MSTKQPERGSILVAMKSNMYLSNPLEPLDDDGDPWDTIFIEKGDCVMFCEEKILPTIKGTFEYVEWVVLYKGGVYSYVFTREKEEYHGFPPVTDWEDTSGLLGDWSVLSGTSDP